jgi:ribonuclease Z
MARGGRITFKMSARIFTALGTASQVPTRERNHNGYLLRWDEEGFLFDPGEGTQRQMLYAGVSVSEITKIFITHLHGDHCLGLPGILQRLSLDRVQHTVELYYPASGRRFIENLKNASAYHNVAQIEDRPVTGPGVIFKGKKYSVIAERLDHPQEDYGYRVQEHDDVTMLPDRLAAFGIRGPDVGRLKQQGSLEVGGRVVKLDEVSVHKRGQSFAFVMDTRACGAAEELAREADLLVIESTYLSTETKEAVENGHLTAAQAATIARRAGANLLVLTHFSQRYRSLEPFVEEARAIHPHVMAVRDGDTVEMPERRKAS